MERTNWFTFSFIQSNLYVVLIYQRKSHNILSICAVLLRGTNCTWLRPQKNFEKTGCNNIIKSEYRAHKVQAFNNSSWKWSISGHRTWKKKNPHGRKKHITDNRSFKVHEKWNEPTCKDMKELYCERKRDGMAPQLYVQIRKDEEEKERDGAMAVSTSRAFLPAPARWSPAPSYQFAN